jgi:HAE1 family hydrophobic/amphiphilic exporter-1
MSLTEIAIKRPSFILVIFITLSVLGIFGYQNLKYELLPKMNWPVITINTAYPGASPTEVENNVTKKIEDALSTLEKIKSIQANSFEGFSAIIVDFEMDVNVDDAVADAQRKINLVQPDLPDEVKTPVINKIALDEIPVLRVGATSNMPNREFFQLVKDQIIPSITKLEGVGQVQLIGGDQREILVNVDKDKLRNYGVSLGQLSLAVNNYNVDFPAGNVKTDADQLVVRVAGKFSSLDQLRNLIVARSPQGGEVKLKEVAEIFDGTKETDNLNRLNGKNSVGILVVKQNDANAVELSKTVRKQFTYLEQEYKPYGVKFDIAQDTSTFTIEAADAVTHDLFIAIGLVALVMLLFLHSLRNAFIVMVAIPASIVGTFLGMYILGFSLNLMTMLGLSLTIGILVDDSIVVLENIYRHMEMGKDRRVAALDGRNEIGFTALSITLVDVVVFLPLAFVGGIIGNIMSQFALVVVVSTLMSLFVSFTITPMLASRFAKLGEPNPNNLGGKFILGFEGWFKRLTNEYAGGLKWAVGSWYGRLTIVAVSLALFFASTAGLGSMGVLRGAFITPTDRGEFTVQVESPSGSTVQETNHIVQRIEGYLLNSVPEVSKVFTNVGYGTEGFIKTTSPELADISVSLTPKDKRTRSTDQIILDIKAFTKTIPGIKVRVNPIGIFGTSDETPIQLIVAGPDRDSVLRAANQALDTLRAIPGATDVKLSATSGKPEAEIEIDRDKLTYFGISTAEVGLAMRTALTGNDDSKYRDGNTDYTIRVQLDNFDRKQVSDIENLTFLSPVTRGPVELKQFATVRQTLGPTLLERYNRNTSVKVLAQVSGGAALGDISGPFIKSLDRMKAKWPVGVTTDWYGEVKNSQDSNASLELAGWAAILFMYLIMVALYDNFVYPFVVLFSIPVAIVGALFGIALALKTIDIFAILGIIMLIGLVGKNAILIVDFANHLREKGMEAKEALVEAGRERLRPILMTTFAMVFGMLPIAIAQGAGSEWKNGLGWALVGGLTSSMFLSLFLVPVMYEIVEICIRFVRRILGFKQPEMGPPIETSVV